MVKHLNLNQSLFEKNNEIETVLEMNIKNTGFSLLAIKNIYPKDCELNLDLNFTLHNLNVVYNTSNKLLLDKKLKKNALFIWSKKSLSDPLYSVKFDINYTIKVIKSIEGGTGNLSSRSRDKGADIFENNKGEFTYPIRSYPSLIPDKDFKEHIVNIDIKEAIYKDIHIMYPDTAKYLFELKETDPNLEYTKKLEYSNGFYFGQIEKDLVNFIIKRSGRGVYVFNSGNIQYGGWKDNHEHGISTTIFKTGDMVIENYIEGKKNGEVKTIYKSGHVFVEHYKDNVKIETAKK